MQNVTPPWIESTYSHTIVDGQLGAEALARIERLKSQ
jgi:hypothetical protein